MLTVKSLFEEVLVLTRIVNKDLPFCLILRILQNGNWNCITLAMQCENISLHWYFPVEINSDYVTMAISAPFLF